MIMRSMLVGFSLVFIGSMLPAADKTPDADGFVTIFDGKSLDGWKKSTENTDSIQLKDGAIVANGDALPLVLCGRRQAVQEFRLQVRGDDQAE